MRIALVSTPYVPVPPPGYGGTELVVSELARALEGGGHEVSVFATGDSHAPGLRFAFSRAVWPPEPYAELIHCRKAAGAVAAGGFDVLHAHAPAMVAFADALPCPTVMTLHHEPTPALDRLYASAPGVAYVAISRRQASLAGFPPAHVVHHGLSPDLYPDTPRAGGDTAFFLGRLSWVKGPELAVEAARRAGLEILVSGKVHLEDEAPEGWGEKVLLPALREPHVRATGVADLAFKRRTFARARALVAPLRWEEPFGLVLVEAALAGCPVVAFPRGAAPEIVEEGVTGFLVEGVGEMALALRWAARLDRKRIQRRARERFSAARMTRDYLAVYRAAIEARARNAAQPPGDLGWNTIAP